MKLSGSYQINLSKQKVWEALNDPEILKKAIPGCEEFTKNSDTEFTATATNKIGPFNASFTGDIELTDLDPPNSYKITGSGNSPVGFASGEATVKLEDNKTVKAKKLGMRQSPIPRKKCFSESLNSGSVSFFILWEFHRIWDRRLRKPLPDSKQYQEDKKCFN